MVLKQQHVVTTVVIDDAQKHVRRLLTWATPSIIIDPPPRKTYLIGYSGTYHQRHRCSLYLLYYRSPHLLVLSPSELVANIIDQSKNEVSAPMPLMCQVYMQPCPLCTHPGSADKSFSSPGLRLECTLIVHSTHLKVLPFQVVQVDSDLNIHDIHCKAQ